MSTGFLLNWCGAPMHLCWLLDGVWWCKPTGGGRLSLEVFQLALSSTAMAVGMKDPEWAC